MTATGKTDIAVYRDGTGIFFDLQLAGRGWSWDGAAAQDIPFRQTTTAMARQTWRSIQTVNWYHFALFS